MTTIYFVRHCKPDGKVSDDRNRPLTEEGLLDSKKVAEILKDKNIDVFISSPYKRSYDTIKEAADSYAMTIQTDERLRERKAGKNSNNHEMFKKRWADLSYAEIDGESIGAVQKRNIEALNEILKKYPGKNIVIGTHGTALSSIINFYDKRFAGDSFMEIIDFMPWILKMEFDGETFISKEDVFHIKKEYKG
ncbi:MAG: histidine phosphatase family protein [Treponema sp.]|nr:histidine phosphatase family protein [Treponema sp.]